MGLAGLTAVFGMGTGVAPPVWSPGMRPRGVEFQPRRPSDWCGSALACDQNRTDLSDATDLSDRVRSTTHVAGASSSPTLTHRIKGSSRL